MIEFKQIMPSYVVVLYPMEVLFIDVTENIKMAKKKL
jgi:hypothetical protein